MSDFIETSQHNSAALIATAKQAYDWSGVLPAACLPGIGPLAEGALSQTKSQMVQDFKRHKKSMVGLPSSSKGLAILLRNVLGDDDSPSELAHHFFDPDRFLVTRTRTVDLAKGLCRLPIPWC